MRAGALTRIVVGAGEGEGEGEATMGLRYVVGGSGVCSRERVVEGRRELEDGNAVSQLGGALFQRGGQGGGGFGGNQGGGNRGGGNQNSRYSMELFAQATNVLNRVTRTGYVGNISSPLFGTPVQLGQPRDINVGLRFNF